MQLLKDRISGFDPAKRLAVGIARGHKAIDALHELLDAGERVAADGALGDQRDGKNFAIPPGQQ